MKKSYVKGLSVVIVVLLITISSYGQVHAVEANSGDIVNDTFEASTLLGKINDAREGVSNAALTQDPSLDKVAYAYASELINADSDFRKTTNFKTLPNGNGVFSLLTANDVTGISHFNYSVWLGNYLNPELTNEFAKKAINGDFTKVGIACATDANGVKAVVLTFAK